jgi:ubiquinone/menaquinone biosynthesis C-methylase UbiE
MRWYDEHVVPRLVDFCCGMDDVRPQREAACAGLSGRVLEIGFGSGLNLPYYPPGVTEVAAVEPSDLAWRMAQQRIEHGHTKVIRSGLDGQRLTEPDESFDHVLSTFTMCTIPDLSAALAEARRVLKPGGALHFTEHGLSPEPGVEKWQHRLEPIQRRMAGGCHLTRRPDEAVQAAGLELQDIATGYLPGPGFTKPFGYYYTGRASRA